MNYTDYYIAALNAEGYYRTAELIKDKAKNPLDIDSFLKFSNPYIIILSLACEFYLKAMLIYWSIKYSKYGSDGHNLWELFRRLDDVDRARVLNAYDSDPCIEDFLKDNEKIFVDHRFPYEKTGEQQEHLLLYAPFESFCNALAVACVEIQQDYLKAEAESNAD